jgi:diamine N-acetyltransferase
MEKLLSNPIVTLRAIEPTDLDLLYRWENDTDLWTVTDTLAPYSRQMLWQYLESYTGDIYASQQVRFVVTLTATGEAVGLLDLMNFDPLNNRAELGLYIAAEHRGKGYGRHALHLIEGYAAGHIGMKQIYVKILATSTDCLALFRSEGYREVGTLNAWVKRGTTYHDAILLQHLL